MIKEYLTVCSLCLLMAFVHVLMFSATSPVFIGFGALDLINVIFFSVIYMTLFLHYFEMEVENDQQ